MESRNDLLQKKERRPSLTSPAALNFILRILSSESNGYRGGGQSSPLKKFSPRFDRKTRKCNHPAGNQWPPSIGRHAIPRCDRLKVSLLSLARTRSPNKGGRVRGRRSLK